MQPSTQTRLPEPDVMFDRLVDHFGVQPNRKGEAWMECPVCHKDARHFSFSERGFKCFVCGYKGSIYTLAYQNGLLGQGSSTVRYEPRKPAAPKPVEIPDWVGLGIEHYLRHPQRFARWQAYKPLTAETIEKHKLGYGRMPFRRPSGEWYWSKREWLIVPLFEKGKLVGLRGRNTGTEGPKWISATGTHYTLWNVDNVRPGSVVYITENYVDAALVMQTYPELAAVAIGGASTWQPTWAGWLVARKPSRVVVCLDNDLAGQATGRMYEQLAAEWRAEKPGVPVMQPNGPKIANDLRRHGVAAKLFAWEDRPAKWDIGSEIIAKLQATA